MRALAAALLCTPAILLPAGAVGAQTDPSHSVSGVVLDAVAARPLVGAMVSLEPVSAGALPSSERGGPAFVQATRSALTDAHGVYRFERLPLGTYRLRVTHVGYRAANLEVELRHATSTRLSVGLEVEPIALRAVEISAPAAASFGRVDASRMATDSSRLRAQQLREQRFLATDTREVTRADVLESVTLAETDLFRALQRLPGVSTRDDYTAELWVRGAPWDQTRVYFDGLPLFNPVHGFGLFSGIGTDAVGAAFLHSGVRPARLGEGSAGVLELKTRRGQGEDETHGVAELSLVSGRVALEWEQYDGRRAVIAAGRRTYLDWASQAVGWLLGRDDLARPYNFSDVVLRVDQHLGRSTTIETSSLISMDEITGNVPGILQRTDATWGNAMARVTLARPMWDADSRHTFGFSGAGTSTRWRTELPNATNDAPDAPPSTSQVLYVTLAGEWAAHAGPSLPSPWTAGYELVLQGADYRGPAAQVYSGPLQALPEFQEDYLALGALWAERRWAVGERLALQTGLRLEIGERVRDAGVLRPSPRVVARYQLRPDLALTAGAARTYQYTQSVGATGPQVIAPQFTPGRKWLVAGDEAPAIRTDIGTAGVEHWAGEWLASANLYLRHTSGIAVPNPTPGEIRDRSLFAVAENQALGAEFSLRRLVGRWTTSLGYAYGSSELQAEGLRYPSSADRRHTLDATGMLRVRDELRLGAAYSFASGAPYTRFIQGTHDCQFMVIGGGLLIPNDWNCTWTDFPRVEAPNAERARSYASLDLLLDWNRPFRDWDLGFFLQVRNALNRDNTITYTRTVVDACTPNCDAAGEMFRGGAPRDEFLRGLPVLPLFGLRVAF